MSKEKFTQGEWSISHDNDLVGEYINVGMAQLYNSYHDTEQSEQNAHDANLIAAAPDMYRMIESLQSELSFAISEINTLRSKDVNSQTETQPELWDEESVYMAEKLLAKARGEQNG